MMQDINAKVTKYIRALQDVVFLAKDLDHAKVIAGIALGKLKVINLQDKIKGEREQNITTAVPSWLFSAIKDEARSQGVSIATSIRRALKEHYAQYAPEEVIEY